jgi:hypothetical protein
MTTTHKWFTLSKKSFAQKLIDWEDDTIKVSLHTSTYTPDMDAHNFQDDLTNEVTATGYTAGGATISTPTLTGGTGELVYDGANVSWVISGSLTFRYAVIYDSTPGSTATNPLISIIDFGTDQTITDGTLTLNFDDAGILKDTLT